MLTSENIKTNLPADIEAMSKECRERDRQVTGNATSIEFNTKLEHYSPAHEFHN